MIPMLPFEALSRVDICRVVLKDASGYDQGYWALGVWEQDHTSCPFSFVPRDRGPFQVILLFPDKDTAKGFLDVLQWSMTKADAAEIMETQTAIAEAEQLVIPTRNRDKGKEC